MSILEIIRTANHNLFRNKVRTALTILAIFIGSFTIILNTAINTGVNAFIDEQIADLGGEDVIMIISEGSISAASGMMTMSQDVQEFNEKQTITSFTEEDIEHIKNIDGINADSIYLPKLLQTSYITSGDKKYEFTRVEGIPSGDYHIAMSAGEMIDYRSLDDEIVLEARYVKPLGFESAEDAIGKTVWIGVKNPLANRIPAEEVPEGMEIPEQPSYYEFEATIVGIEANGIFTSADNVVSRPLEGKLYEATTSYLPEEMRNSSYYIQASFDNSRFTEEEIKQKLKDEGLLGITLSDMMGMIRSFFDVILVVFTIFGGIALLAAAIGIINTLLMAVEERTREIGLDKALGMSSGKIFVSFSAEAIMLGFWGSAFGVLIAILVGAIVNSSVHAPGGFLEVFPTFELFKFTIGNVLPIIITVMIIAFVAGTTPAWKAAHKDPIEALRYE